MSESLEENGPYRFCDCGADHHSTSCEDINQWLSSVYARTNTFPEELHSKRPYHAHTFFSRAGLCYSGNGSNHHCFSCSLTFCDRLRGDKLFEAHQRFNPNCRFIIKAIASQKLRDIDMHGLENNISGKYQNFDSHENDDNIVEDDDSSDEDDGGDEFEQEMPKKKKMKTVKMTNGTMRQKGCEVSIVNGNISKLI